MLKNTEALVTDALTLTECFVTGSLGEEAIALTDMVDTGLRLRCCSCSCSFSCSCSCGCGMHCCSGCCGQVGVGRWVGYTFVGRTFWKTLINLLFFTGRNVPGEVTDVDNSVKKSSLKAVLENTRALVTNTLALTERFVTGSLGEEPISFTDVVDTGLRLRCCTCGRCCGSRGRVWIGGWDGHTFVVEVCRKGASKRKGENGQQKKLHVVLIWWMLSWLDGCLFNSDSTLRMADVLNSFKTDKGPQFSP